jgi:predicted DNA-binding ribbon-helix-helix protein
MDSERVILGGIRLTPRRTRIPTRVRLLVVAPPEVKKPAKVVPPHRTFSAACHRADVFSADAGIGESGTTESSILRRRRSRSAPDDKGERPMKSSVVKRSIVIAGHKTSVSLEDAFWRGLKEIAGGRASTLSELVAAIDGERHHGNLSSAIRLYVLDHYRGQGKGVVRDVVPAQTAPLAMRAE